MAKRKSIPRKPLPLDDPRPRSEEMQALRKQIQHLPFEVDVLKETLTVLKKDPSVDLTALKNREKAVRHLEGEICTADAFDLLSYGQKQLRSINLKEAAKKVEDGIEETLTYCDFPSER